MRVGVRVAVWMGGVRHEACERKTGGGWGGGAFPQDKVFAESAAAPDADAPAKTETGLGLGPRGVGVFLWARYPCRALWPREQKSCVSEERGVRISVRVARVEGRGMRGRSAA